MATTVSESNSVPRVVLFDFNDVLIHGNAFGLFVRERNTRSKWRKWLLLLCSPLLLVLWPLSRWVRTRIALIGLSEEHYAQLAQSMAGVLARRPGLFCRDGLQMFRRHMASGDRVIVVTDDEQQLVQGIFSELGLSGFELLASHLGPSWLGIKRVVHNASWHKVERLAAMGVTTWAQAYGVSARDLPIFRLATDPVLVNGTPKLCKKLEKALGRSLSRVAWR